MADSFTLVNDNQISSNSKLNKSIEDFDANSDRNIEENKVSTSEFVIVKPSDSPHSDRSIGSRTESMFDNGLFLSKLIKMDYKD